MYFNNRNYRQTSVYGCSSTGLIIGAILFMLMIFGGLVLVLRYLGLIIVLGLVVWLFRKFLNKDSADSSSETQTKESQSRNWSRNFERKENTSYDNVERDFEEVDEDEMDDF